MLHRAPGIPRHPAAAASQTRAGLSGSAVEPNRIPASRHSKPHLLAPSLAGILVDGTTGPEGVKGERKGDVVRHVGEIAAVLALHGYVPDVPSAGDRMTVEGGCLSRFPFENQLAAADRALAPQQTERPSFVTPRGGLDRHDPLHRLDALRRGSIVQERLLAGRVIADVGIGAVVARAGIVGDEHLPLRKALAENGKGFQARGDQPKLPPGHRADDGVARELLPPALRLAVVPKSNVRPSDARSKTSTVLHSGQ